MTTTTTTTTGEADLGQFVNLDGVVDALDEVIPYVARVTLAARKLLATSLPHDEWERLCDKLAVLDAAALAHGYRGGPGPGAESYCVEVATEQAERNGVDTCAAEYSRLNDVHRVAMVGFRSILDEATRQAAEVEARRAVTS